MEQGAKVLQIIVAAGFLGLGVVSVRASLRRPSPRMRALAGALGLLGVLPVLSLIDRGFGGTWASSLSIPVFVGSGFALLIFRHRLIPLPRPVLPVLGATAVIATAVALASGLDGAGPRSSLQTVAGVALILVWIACVLEPTLQFWRTARLRPIIQRSRLRSLSAGYLGVIFVALTSQPSKDHIGLLLASQIVVAVVVPLLWIALVPPAWLRRSWQSRERVTRAAVDAMVRFVGDEGTLALRGLTWARAIVGGEGAALIDDGGRVLGISDLDESRARSLMAAAGEGEATLVEDGVGSAVVAPIPLNTGSGSLIVTSGPFSPLFDAHETDEIAAFASTLAIAVDRVRTLARHRSQSEHYAGVVQAMDDLGEGFLVTDGRRLVFANDAYCRITGYSLQELMALESLAALAPPEEIERLAERRRERARGGQVERYDSALIRKDGTVIDLEVSMKIVGTPEQPSIVCIVRDITDRKRGEERLLAALEREHEAVRRLESLDEMKNAFLSAVSHELRTPLTGVLGFARTLQTLGETMEPAERVNVVDRLTSNAEKLDRLLSDLLDLDRLSRGIIEPKRRPLDLGGLVRGVLREFRATSQRDDVVSDIDPVVVSVDRAQMERVVENLLTNAARHTPEDTPIWVTVKETGDGAEIVIEDAGPGVPESLRREIFEPFRQGPSLRAHSPGVGIGLALVRRFVDLHGGFIDVGGRKGGGASFRVSLPAAEAERPTIEVRHTPEYDAGSLPSAHAG